MRLSFLSRPRLVSLALLWLALVVPAIAAESVEIASPNGRVQARANVGETLSYSLTYDGNVVLRDSKIALTFRGADPFGEFEPVETKTRTIDDAWKGVGRATKFVDRCVETTLVVRELAAPRRELRLLFRAYDEGLALRVEIPENSGLFDKEGEFCVESDDTEFAFERDFDVWFARFNGFATNSEGFFQRGKLSDLKNDSFIARPLVVLGDDFVAAITESDLLDWSGALLTGTDDPTTVRVRLAPRDDGRGAVVRKGACASPWRVVVLAKNPAELIDRSDIVRNVASPCDFDASWVEPGNCSWDWWAPKKGRKITTEALKEFVDFSAEMGWEYVLVDAGWYQKKGKAPVLGPEGLVVKNDFDPKALVDYGKTKGVKILLWIDWPDIIQTDIRGTLERVAKWGVVGVKIDHMNSRSQEMVAALTDAVQIAAENKLLVNFHGMFEPTGLERTFPNQITREGIQGNEYFRGRALEPTFVASLPYTRCLLGPGDYTPGGFRNATRETYKPLKEQTEDDASTMVLGTRAHELALCVALDSPLRCLCDLPRVYREQKGLEFLKALPAAWDETKALDGEIGEFCAMARRSGDRWFVSAFTNEKARELEIPLDFLDDAEYQVVYYRDAPDSDKDATAIDVATETVRGGDSEKIQMTGIGGWNAIYTKK